MKVTKIRSLASIILEKLEQKTDELLNLGFTIMFNPRKLTRGMSIYQDYNYPIYKRINNLKSSPYFNFNKDTGDFYLNNKGRVEIIKNIIAKKKKIKKWDLVWRIVIFDVPESKRRDRDFLRRELKWMGFKELQHSVWISPYNIEKELLCLLELWRKDFRGDIRFVRAQQVVDDHEFRKMFVL
ncbi:MAG: hypothetical protein AAB340_00920 [Patescibacteria group bacterium]